MLSSNRSNPEEEYVSIELDTPQRKTLQALFQLAQPSVSDFSSDFSSNNKKPYQNNFHPHNKKHKPFNNKKPQTPIRSNLTQYPRKTSSPYASKPVPQFNSNNQSKDVPQQLNSNSIDFSNPLVTLLLLAAVSKSQPQTPAKGNIQTQNSQNTQSATESNQPKSRFTYSSKLSPWKPQQRPSRSPGKSPRSKSPSIKGKKVYWADEKNSFYSNPNNSSGLIHSGFLNYSNTKKQNAQRNHSRSSSRGSRGSSVNSQKSNFSYNSYTNNNSGKKRGALKGILKTKMKYNSNGQVAKVQKILNNAYAHNNSTILGKRSPRPPTQVAGDWACPNPKCNNLNFAMRTQCNRCRILKPEGLDVGLNRQVRLPLIFKKGDWNCIECTNANFAKRSTCNRCLAERPLDSYQDFRPRKKVKRELNGHDTVKSEESFDNIEWKDLEEGEIGF